MRDAFGGAFSIQLMLIFLILYVSFLCIALNYARAFRVKNEIINIIEQYEGYNDDVGVDISNYLRSSGYYISQGDVNVCRGCDFHEPGYSTMEVNSHNSATNQKYYYVETYLVFTLPIVNVHFPISVKGETRVIELP